MPRGLEGGKLLQWDSSASTDVCFSEDRKIASKHMKVCSVSLVIRKMRVTAKVRNFTH